MLYGYPSGEILSPRWNVDNGRPKDDLIGKRSFPKRGTRCRKEKMTVRRLSGRLLDRKTLDNNDLNQVRAVSRGLSHKNALEAHQNGGLSFGCYDLFLSTIDSVFSLENVLKNVFKNINRVSQQEEYFCNKSSKLLLCEYSSRLLFRLQSLLFKWCLDHFLNNKDLNQVMSPWLGRGGIDVYSDFCCLRTLQTNIHAKFEENGSKHAFTQS